MITLNEQQAEMVELAYQYNLRNRQVFEFSGDAGTGKSVVLKEIQRKLCLHDNEIIALAPTGQAAIVMRTKGFQNARTIHSALFRSKLVPVLDDNGNPVMNTALNRPEMALRFVPIKKIDKHIKAIFIDEGRMVPLYMKNILLNLGVMIIVAGDQNQLGPVKAKPAFIDSPNIPRLTMIMRQKENDAIVRLAHMVLKGKNLTPGLYGNNVMVIDKTDITNEVLSFGDIVLCGTNRTRNECNYIIRNNIKGIKRNLPVYGDRMICRKNNWRIEEDGINLTNGLVGTVVSMPDMTTVNGNSYMMDFMPDLASSPFYNVHCNLKFLNTLNSAEKEAIKKLDRMDGEMFEYAYCSTVHLAQGSEYFNGVYLQESMGGMYRNLDYTALTRFKGNLIIVRRPTKTYV